MEGKLTKLEGKKFPLGQLVMTRGVSDLVGQDLEFAAFVLRSLQRHAQGDWGDLGEEDRQANEFSVDKELRLLSAYLCPRITSKGIHIWIITEADRSVTTVLFPEEY